MKGNRTYLTVAAGALYVLGAKLGYWPADPEIIGAIGLLAIGFLRSGVQRVAKS